MVRNGVSTCLFAVNAFSELEVFLCLLILFAKSSVSDDVRLLPYQKAISTPSEVFLQNHASSFGRRTTRKSKNALL
jgi:hypothetical protein